MMIIMADLSTDTINALNAMFGSLSRSGGKLREELDNLDTATSKQNKSGKSNQILSEKILKTNAAYNEKLNKLNETLNGTDKRMSILAASIKMANTSLDDLVASNDVSAKYLQDTFPKKLASGLSSFMSKTGLVIKDFRDVMRLQDIGNETKRMLGILEEGNKNQYDSIRSYIKLIDDSGMSFDKLTGMTNTASRQMAHWSRIAENSTVSEKGREKAKAAMVSIVNSHLKKMGSVVDTTTASMAELAESEKKLSKSLSNISGPIKAKLETAVKDLLVTFGKKVISETMDVAREGLLRGVEPFSTVAGQMYISGKEYQQVMADNINAVHSSIGGYAEFNKLMTSHNNEYLKITGMDPAMAARTEAESMTMMKTFYGSTMSAKELSAGLSQTAKGAEKFRNITGDNAEQYVQLNQRLAENYDLQNSMLSMNGQQRMAMRESIAARVAEYRAMNISKEKAEELAVAMHKASGMEDVADVFKKTALMQAALVRGGMKGGDAAKYTQYRREEALGVVHTPAQDKAMTNIFKEAGKAASNLTGSSTNLSEAISKNAINAKTIGEAGSEYGVIGKTLAQGARGVGNAQQPGSAAGPGSGTQMAAGQLGLAAKNVIDGINKNATANWLLWGTAIVGAILLKGKGGAMMEGATNVASKVLGKGGMAEPYLQAGGKMLGAGSKALLKKVPLIGGIADAGFGINDLLHGKEQTTMPKGLDMIDPMKWGMYAGHGINSLTTQALGGESLGSKVYDWTHSGQGPSLNTPMKLPTAPAHTPANRATIEKSSQDVTPQEKVVDINQQLLQEFKSANTKLDKTTKLLDTGNELYTMTEEQKKRLMKPIYTGRH